MHFDDRLATVLAARVEGQAVARIQYRQLLDLLGTNPVEVRSPQVIAAFERLSALSAQIPVQDRAAVIGEPGLRLRSSRLVAELGNDASQVAAAAIAKAQLDEEQWLDLIPALPPAARGLLRQRRGLGPRVDDLLARLGVGQIALPAGAAEHVDAEPAAVSAETGIGAIVKKIEAYRRARQTPDAANANDAPRLPLGEEPAVRSAARPACFDFATDAVGVVTWADPGMAAMVVGFRLFDADKVHDAARAALSVRRRQPLVGLRLTMPGGPALAGDWHCDAAPQFDRLSGRFLGYAGRLRRIGEAAPAPAAPTAMTAAHRSADHIRQLLHELRTPVGAIQGFAEVIQQQLFGPAPHEYRALAATIAGDAARVLAAFEELERYAKLQSDSLQIEPGTCDFASQVAQAVARIEPFAKQRGSGFDARCRKGSYWVAMAPIEAERIVWRLLATVAGTSGPNEVLALKLANKGATIRLKVDLPAALASRDDAGLFGAAIGSVPQTIASGMFGVGFALRLARAEAVAAGGGLQRRGKELLLRLPALTVAEPGLSDEPGMVSGSPPG